MRTLLGFLLSQERPLAAVLESIMAQATIAYLEKRYLALEKEIADALLIARLTILRSP